MSMFSEEDLAGLSEAEREALRDLAEDDQDLQATAGESGEAGAATAAADHDDDDESAAAAAANKPAEGAATGADDAAAGAAPDAGEAGAADDDADAATPATIQPVSPADADEQRTALRAEKATALQQLLDGEIDQEAYQEVESRVQDKLDDLARAAAVDMARNQMQQDAMMQEYGQHLGAARKELKAAGIDLEGEAGAQFDRAIRLFAQDAIDRGLTDAMGNMAASRDALAEAQALMLRRFGKASGAAPAAAPAAAAPAAPSARKPAAADRSALPPTLAGVPAAADASVGNEFAHLDGLEGTALEKALARMTPDQQERYLGA
ncbi:gas vesicle protein GvpG [Comamonas sp. C11]|uniref:gas vesicle protein GvpG n=1 Tax=Comamonas sp. C11 TaxID=2966554 RepID=UPI002111FACF|nr:gas vesicle protein GvpG [Comamonas sp. C11]UUC95592.1 gas vesicle protein GvpG [Comamonas sp. C11]